MNHYRNENFEIIQNNRDNIIAKLKSTPNDFYFIWQIDRVEFQEIKGGLKEQGLIRVFSITEQGCKLQFRATQSLAGQQKEKNLIATAFLSKEDLQYILSKMEK